MSRSPELRRPVPAIVPESEPYWAGAKRGELVIQRCGACQRWSHPPSFTCPTCQSDQVGHHPVSGTGTVYSYSIMHMPGVPGFADLPYAVVIVELAEQDGLRTVGNLVDCSPADISIGMPVEVTFEPLTPEITLPQWRRATSP